MNYLEQLPVMIMKVKDWDGVEHQVLIDGDYDGEYISGYVWYRNPKTGYIYRNIYKRDADDGYVSSQYLHQLVASPPKGMWVTHINGDKLDNRSANLRIMTPKDLINEVRPMKKFANNTRTSGDPSKPWYSGYRGVCRSYRKDKGKPYQFFNSWTAKIKGKNIGTYPTEEMAAKMYDREAFKLWGDRAVLNFPKEEK